MRLNTCRLLNIGLQRQIFKFFKERSNNCEVKYLSVAKCWFTTTSNLFLFRKGQLIVRLNTCRLLNIGLQRQVVYLFKGTIKQL